ALPVSAFAVTPFDSLALENDKGKLYVIHKVEKKETLFGLLRRYHCKPAEIMAANPTLDGSSTIYENQVLRVP
ncbi:MAG: LysM domain-containing protein, partial [Spirosomataceae bacterium]